jgi:hypothetical protein
MITLEENICGEGGDYADDNINEQGLSDAISDRADDNIRWKQA